ncbi:TonB-dependent receptor domain-containing protein [Saccharospirillum impatiens]|uniref:TonB-dependent receptor domain-containing protein n=1 Tax=Saccharospirillum impatiens TaxID=169438 RepID=UPI0004160C98|nr:TonB-dependent receptor [Saccharospirillum impatiens]
MNRITFTAPILLLTSALPTTAVAEDVVVTATRYETPITQTLSAVTVLTEEDLKRYQDDDLGTLLSRLAGVGLVNSGSLGATSNVLLRGTSSSQVLVLIDGVPSVSASTGQTSFSSIPLSNIERIEVVRGPVSSLYGANGIGGVIQVFTKSPAKANDDVYVTGSYGSNNFRRVGAGFQFSTDKTRAAADIFYTGTDGFDSTTLTSDSNKDADGFSQYAGNLSVDTRLSDDLLLGINHIQSSSKAHYDSVCYTGFTATEIDWQTQTELVNSSLSLDYDLSGTTRFSTRIGRYVDDSVNSDGDDSANDTQFKTTGYTANALAERNLGDVTAILGLDVDSVELESTTNYDENERLNTGIFTSLATYVGDFGLQGSLRFDNNSAYDTYTTGTLGASYLVNDSLELIGSAGTAFRAPSFNELYFPGYGDENVEPEESRSVELALRQFTVGGEWRLSAYRIDTTNLIGSDPNTVTATNINEARIHGLELDVTQQFGAFDLAVNSTLTDARDADDERLNNRPEWTLFAALGYDYGQWRFNTDLQTESGRKNGAVALGDYAILGLGSRISLNDSSTLSARVDNVLDEDYVTNYDSSSDSYYNTPGRSFKLSAKYHF